MPVREFVVETARKRDGRGLLRAWFGAALLALGLLVAAFPQILVILVSTLIAAAGLGLLISGLRARFGRPTRVVDVDRFFRF